MLFLKRQLDHCGWNNSDLDAIHASIARGAAHATIIDRVCHLIDIFQFFIMPHLLEAEVQIQPK